MNEESGMSEVVKYTLSPETVATIIEDIRKQACDVLPDAGEIEIDGGTVHVFVPLLDGRALLGLEGRTEGERNRVEEEGSGLEGLNENGPFGRLRSFHQLSVAVLEGSHWVVTVSGGVRVYRKGVHV